MSAVTVAAPAHHAHKLHPLPIRIMHWTNAVAMIIMIGSGWKIYNDEVMFGWLHFPDALTIGHWAQHGLQWHFFGMWIAGDQRDRLSHLWPGHRAFPPDAAADPLAAS